MPFMNSLTFLERGAKAKPQPLYVLHGDEPFLKREVLLLLRRLVLGPEADSFALSTLSGDKAVFAGVRDELETLPFLSPRRLVVIENADPFVTRERARLEKYFPQLLERNPFTGVLVLDMQTWAANTRLAKLVPDSSVLACKAPPTTQLAAWCQEWCSARHGKELTEAGARHLVDLVDNHMGQLAQEIEKLALFAGQAPRIDVQDVDQLVGQSRAENTWKIFDLIGAGQAADSLTLLGRLFDQGEEPIRLLGAFSLQLRRLAQAARLNSQGVSLAAALEEVGVPPFARRNAEQQLRHLGRRRAAQLFDWLLQTDLGMKGSGWLPPRMLLERLVVQLSRSRS
jgi:DNA polymerase-3 subunit delta